MTEDWATRPADRLFYAQDKAELEHLLQEEAARHPGTVLYLLRPPTVLGPDAVGAKVSVPDVFAPVVRAWEPRYGGFRGCRLSRRTSPSS